MAPQPADRCRFYSANCTPHTVNGQPGQRSSGDSFRISAFCILVLSAIFLISAPLSAQYYTYFSGSIGAYSTFIPEIVSPVAIRDGGLADGGSNRIALRQQMGNYFSLELGYSASYLDPLLQVEDRNAFSGGSFQSHRFSLKTNFDVRIFKNRVAAYGTFGYLFSLEEAGGVRSTELCNPINVRIVCTYLPDSGNASFLSTGVGLRVRLIHELLFEMETGYASSFRELYSIEVHYTDLSGVTNVHMIEEGKAYVYFRFGLSYPLQPVCRLLGKGVDYLLAL